jgi:hypothetical protein
MTGMTRHGLNVAWCGLALALTSIIGTTAHAEMPAMHGRAAAAAIVQRGQVRFTVLTAQLIRMEWSPDSRFVDDPSQVFIDRDQPVPHFTVTTSGGKLRIETASLQLSYVLGSGKFDARNLQIRSRKLAPAFDWHPGDPETGNLHGTARTMDRYSGDINIDSGKRLDLGQGLLSRDGWHVVDDSTSFLFDADPRWQWAKPRGCADCQDLYFFGYGHQYQRALGDYAAVAGRQPMPPRFAFGYWWSRYWNYSDREMRDLVGDFERYQIPLDVMVIDMDWHRTDDLSWDAKYVKRDEVGESVGWTGYTWNRSLFPEPDRFLGWLHDHKLKTTLNLHPASGIPAREESYPASAKAMGVTDGAPVSFEAADKRFVQNWFDKTLDPLARQGVDFWWLDWQQWPTSKLMPGLSNTWWLNYVFYTRMQQTSRNRALIYHRWGGLGNHRYQIGFSGDSVISWASLAYQPYFTATASNVLYGYWTRNSTFAGCSSARSARSCARILRRRQVCARSRGASRRRCLPHFARRWTYATSWPLISTPRPARLMTVGSRSCGRYIMPGPSSRRPIARPANICSATTCLWRRSLSRSKTASPACLSGFHPAAGTTTIAAR